jgi:formylglycine-generating enzyme required for sulfatase activity
MSRIFISYRRDDSAGYAGRLYDRLSERFGGDQIFMDIDTIEPGLDFVEVIEKAVGSCDALIALIGRQWLTITDAAGRRLDKPEDPVRLEIATALDRNIRVIPVLVRGATMPRSTDLPDALKKLARRNALEISDTRFHYDVDRLIETLEKVLGMPEPAPPTPEVRRKEKAAPARQPFEPEMVLIPAGEFLMGSDPRKDEYAVDDEQPQHTLHLPDYHLAKTPVTNAQYAAFMQATSHKQPEHWEGEKPPKGKEGHPVVYVSWHDAIAYCQWLAEVTGKPYRLPSEAEWEKGARGSEGLIYPWGNRWDARRCNSAEGGKGDTTPVGAYPQGASPYGLLDMAGNVSEWTRSLWGVLEWTRSLLGEDWGEPSFKYPYDPADGREDLDAPDSVLRVLRGGAFHVNRGAVRCSRRLGSSPNVQWYSYGFRVVLVAPG